MFQRMATRRIAWMCVAQLLIPRGMPCQAETVSGIVCRDVELSPGGVFRGEVRDVHGGGHRGQTVVLRHPDETMATAVTDDEGHFLMAGLTGGTYTIQVGRQVHPVRLWMPGTAPPHAASPALFVVDDPLVRGQRPIQSLVGCEPLMIGVLIAAAIAIPVALHDSGDEEPGS